MRVLGLSAGASERGSADILLKCALRAAEAAGADVSMVRVDDLDLALTPERPDDADWFWERLLDADALIVATPIYSRTVPGKLRLLGDRISGPQADVAFTTELLRMRAAGDPISVDFAIDERVLKPRVAGFLAVGGSLPSRWKTLALPLLHTLTASMQIAVVDQVQFAGAGSPSAIVLDRPALDRAARLGRAVAEQIGRGFDDVKYAGDPGVCPLCRLSVFDLRDDGAECATCGAFGRLELVDGRPQVVFDADGLGRSILTLGEKVDHFHEVQSTAAQQRPLLAATTALVDDYAAWDRRVRPETRASD